MLNLFQHLINHNSNSLEILKQVQDDVILKLKTMKKYTDINDITNISQTINEAIQIKKTPFKHKGLGANKTLVMLFFNASLRTRLSTEKAAKNLAINQGFAQAGGSASYIAADDLARQLSLPMNILTPVQSKFFKHHYRSNWHNQDIMTREIDVIRRQEGW